MSWKSWLPYYGDQSVRKKLREIDQAGIGVPMLIILFLQKSFELVLMQVGNEIPIPVWATFLIAALTVFVLYVYNEQLKEKSNEAKEKAKEKVAE